MTDIEFILACAVIFLAVAKHNIKQQKIERITFEKIKRRATRRK